MAGRCPIRFLPPLLASPSLLPIRPLRARLIGLISLVVAGVVGIGVPLQPGRGQTAAVKPATAPAGAPAPASATGLVTIEADSQTADNATGIITARGNVRITYPDRQLVATSRQAQYFSKEGRLVLTGDVDVIDERGQRLQAERVVYLLDSERLLAQPPAGGQVLSRFRMPPPSTAAPAATEPAAPRLP